MASNIVPISQAKMPAKMKERLQSGRAVNRNLAEGVADSFPRLSIKGSKFHIRMDGETKTLFDPQSRAPFNYLDVVLVNGSNVLSKAYYKEGFSDDGEFSPPDCWSLDSVKPDATIVNPVNPICQTCPMNAFGSAAPTRDGQPRAGKACQDSRRIAVLMPSHLQQQTDDGEPKEPLVFMMRVPQTSLKNLKAYAQNLDRNGWETAGCVTRLTFAGEVAYPKLNFSFVDGLADEEYEQVADIADGDFVKTMLKTPDFDNAATQKAADQVHEPARSPRQRQAAPAIGEEELEAPAEAPTAEVPPKKAAKPDLKTVEKTLVELPTGELLDPETGEIVERPAPKVEMPRLDEDTITMKDGRYFNKRLNAFVTGPEYGAPKWEDKKLDETPAVSPKQRKAKPKKEKEPVAEASPEKSEPVDEAPKVNGNGAEQTVTPASQGLESVLRSVLPNSK